MSSRASGTGSFGNGPNIHEQSPSDFDRQARAALNGEQRFNDSSPNFDQWSPEKQRTAYEGLQRADANVIEQNANADTFLALHPEIPDTDHNAQVLNSTLEALHGKRVYTIPEFENAARVARANNLLQLDQAELAKQAKAATQQRAKVERARIVYRTEEELEAMPLEEIRRLDTIERQKQMQRVGEEGGSW